VVFFAFIPALADFYSGGGGQKNQQKFLGMNRKTLLQELSPNLGDERGQAAAA
jgi:hypothetical protein